MATKKNISYGNLIQLTKQHKLGWKWKRVSSVKEPFLYAVCPHDHFSLFAETSLNGDETLYSFFLVLKLGPTPSFNLQTEEQEIFLDGGFFDSQSTALLHFVQQIEKLKAML